MFVSTTSTIYGHRIVEFGNLIWGNGIARKMNDAILEALHDLKNTAKERNYNAIVNITQSMTWNSEEQMYAVTLMGTMVKVE